MNAFDPLATTLLLVWAAFLLGGFVFGRGSDPTWRMPRWTRLASSATLVTLGWYGFGLARQGAAGDYTLLIAVGMTLGFAGDLFLAGLLPPARNVLAGMVAFGLGHVAYITAMVRLTGVRWDLLLLWLVVGALLCYWIVLRGRQRTLLHWMALPYGLLLSATAGVATGLALQWPAFLPLAVGAALFLLSDLVLAAQLFNQAQFPLIGDVIWLTYGPGQMLIVTSIWRLMYLPNGL